MDLAFQRTDGSVGAWLMDGVKLVQATYFDPYHPGDPSWRIVGTADMNRDGKTDLIWQHSGTSYLAVWFMNGTALASARLLDPYYPYGTWKMVAP